MFNISYKRQSAHKCPFLDYLPLVLDFFFNRDSLYYLYIIIFFPSSRHKPTCEFDRSIPMSRLLNGKLL